MPELPEVETIKRDLESHVLGRTITEVVIHDTKVIRSPGSRQFVSRLKGKRIRGIRRHGKALIFIFENENFLMVQLGMTGQLIYGDEQDGGRVTFKLDNQKYLNYKDQR